MKLRLVLVLIALVIPSAQAHGACNLRCPTDGGSQIVCDGDTKFEVITKCGEADFIEEVGYVSSGRFRKFTDENEVRGAFGEFTRKVEKWYYNCGEGQFIKEVIFEGNEIVSIDSTGQRGSGPHRCW